MSVREPENELSHPPRLLDGWRGNVGSHCHRTTAPTFSAYFATYLELIGGFALIVGLFTPMAAFLLCCKMIGATFTAHAGDGFSQRDNGYEYVLALAAFCIVIAAQGSGRFGLDTLWLRRLGWRRPVGRAVADNAGEAAGHPQPQHEAVLAQAPPEQRSAFVVAEDFSGRPSRSNQ